MEPARRGSRGRALDPEGVWCPALEEITEGRTYRGHAGLRQYFEDLAEFSEESHVEYPEVHDLGDRVLGLGRVWVRFASGVELDQETAVLLTWRNGRCVEGLLAQSRRGPRSRGAAGVGAASVANRHDPLGCNVPTRAGAVHPFPKRFQGGSRGKYWGLPTGRKPRSSGAFRGGRSRTRTWDLFLIRRGPATDSYCLPLQTCCKFSHSRFGPPASCPIPLRLAASKALPGSPRGSDASLACGRRTRCSPSWKRFWGFSPHGWHPGPTRTCSSVGCLSAKTLRTSYGVTLTRSRRGSSALQRTLR